MSIATIKTAIQNILENDVDGFTGVVLPKIVYLQTRHEIESVSVNGLINAIGFMQTTRRTRVDNDRNFESDDLETINREFIVIAYIEHVPSNDTFETMDNLCENICNAFNDNQNLNGTVNDKYKCDMMSNVLVAVTPSRLCHIASFELSSIGYREIEIY